MTTSCAAATVHLTGQVRRDRDTLRQLGPQWAQLFARSGCENVFLSIEWMEEWWLHYGRGQSLFIVTLSDPAGILVGVAPFCIGPPLGHGWGPRSLKFLGSKWVFSDHLDVLVAPGLERAAAETVAKILLEHQRDWAYLELGDYDEGSATMMELRAALSRLGLKQQVIQRRVCPYIPLPDSFDTYLGRLHSTWQRNFRHALRQMQRAGEVRLLVLKDSTEIKERFPELLRLHRLRFEQRGERSTFVDDRTQAFHSAVLARIAPRGWARLYLLDTDHKIVAAYYGFLVRRRLQLMQSGFDPVCSGQSVGLVVVGLAIEESIRSGHMELDFLRGDERYKFHWTDHFRETATVRCFKPGPIGSLMFAAARISTSWATARHMCRLFLEDRPALARLARRVRILPRERR